MLAFPISKRGARMAMIVAYGSGEYMGKVNALVRDVSIVPIGTYYDQGVRLRSDANCDPLALRGLASSSAVRADHDVTCRDGLSFAADIVPVDLNRRHLSTCLTVTSQSVACDESLRQASAATSVCLHG